MSGVGITNGVCQQHPFQIPSEDQNWKVLEIIQQMFTKASFGIDSSNQMNIMGQVILSR